MADKSKVAEQYYSPPPKLGKWEGFKLFLWNGETSQILGRTGGSWAKILLFYLLFYAALVGFFAAMLAVFWQTLEVDRPKWQLDNGLIGSNPGLGFRPMPPEANLGSTLIWYKSDKPENVVYWVNTTDKFLKSYQNQSEKTHETCDFGKQKDERKVCGVNLGEPFRLCSPDKAPHERYGFSKKRPCVFLKLNKIFNWIPEVYNTTVDLPEDMPVDVIDAIKREPNKQIIWVSCEGENPADVESIGNVQYFPMRGFPAYYFPYVNAPNYMPPIVAVYFESPKHGVLINIECKAWARNIKLDRADRKGSVHFELMID